MADIDISITSAGFEEFKKNVLILFDGVKKNCEHRGEVYYEEVKTIASIKYKFYGPGLCRPIDVFCIPYSPAKMVKKFHVHAVKMYYDNKVTMFRSCIATLLGGVNESYKWFSCNKIPIDVLLKYTQRGLSIIFNQNERDATSNFLHTDTRWGLILENLEIEPENIYCCVTNDHPFFRPGMFKSGIRKDLREFNLPVAGQFVSSQVIPEVSSVFPFGDLRLKDNDKQFPPVHSVINDYLDFAEECEYDDDM